MIEAAVGVDRSAAEKSLGLRVEVLTDVTSLVSIRHHWRELVRSSHEGSAFTGPTYALDWYQSVEHRGGVYVLAVWRGDVLVGAMPLSLTQVGGFKLLTSMGAEDSYYGDPLLASEPRTVAELIIDHLSRVTARGAAALNLRRLLSNGLILKILQTRQDIDVHTLRAKPQSIIRFDEIDDVDGYFRQVSRKHKVERCRRRLSEHVGPVNYVPEDPEPDRAATIMIDMLERRYGTEAGQAPPFAAKAKALLTSSLFQELIDAGEARISALVVDGKRAAVSADVVAGSRLDAEYVVHEPDLARYSVGSIKMHDLLQHAYHSGITTVELGSARFDYKSRWATHTDELQDVLVTARGIPGALARTARRAAMSYRVRWGVGRSLARLRLSGERNFG